MTEKNKKGGKFMVVAVLVAALAIPVTASGEALGNPVIGDCPVCRAFNDLGMGEFWQWLVALLGGDIEPDSRHAHPWRDAGPILD